MVGVDFKPETYEQRLDEANCLFEGYLRLPRRFYIITEGLPIPGNNQTTRLEQLRVPKDTENCYYCVDQLNRSSIECYGRLFPDITGTNGTFSVPVKMQDGLFLMQFDRYHGVSVDWRRTVGNASIFELRETPLWKDPAVVDGKLQFVHSKYVCAGMRTLVNWLLIDAALPLLGLGLTPYVVLWITEWLHADMRLVPEVRRITVIERMARATRAAAERAAVAGAKKLKQ